MYKVVRRMAKILFKKVLLVIFRLKVSNCQVDRITSLRKCHQMTKDLQNTLLLASRTYPHTGGTFRSARDPAQSLATIFT